MRKLLSVLLLFTGFSAHALDWPAFELRSLRAARTVADYVCPNNPTSAGSAVCELHALAMKDFGKQRMFKFTSPVPSSLIFEVGPRNLRIDRTDKPTLFKVNGKEIDLKDFSGPSQFLEAIEAAMPRAAASLDLPFWFSRADAADAEEERFKAASAIVQQLITLTNEQETCLAYTFFGKTCVDAVLKFNKHLEKRKSEANAGDPKAVLVKNRDLLDKMAYMNMQLSTLQSKMNEKLTYVASSKGTKFSDCGCAETPDKCKNAKAKLEMEAKLKGLYSKCKEEVAKNKDLTYPGDNYAEKIEEYQRQIEGKPASTAVAPATGDAVKEQ